METIVFSWWFAVLHVSWFHKADYCWFSKCGAIVQLHWDAGLPTKHGTIGEHAGRNRCRNALGGCDRSCFGDVMFQWKVKAWLALSSGDHEARAPGFSLTIVPCHVQYGSLSRMALPGIMKLGFSLTFRLETSKRSLIDLHGLWSPLRYSFQLLRRKSRQGLLAWCLMFADWNTIEDIISGSWARELHGRGERTVALLHHAASDDFISKFWFVWVWSLELTVAPLKIWFGLLCRDWQ
jgi:hypothetical protein